MNQQELRAASSIGLLYLIRMLGLFMVLPVLPLAVPDVAGATPFLIGVALGIYGLSQGFLQIPFGLISDRLGRKPVIVAGLLLFIAGSFVAGFSDSIVGLIVGRFLQGCGAIASTLLALMSDLTRVDQRSRSMAVIGISIGASFGLSLVMGPMIARHFGLAGIFHLTGMLGVVGLFCILLLVPTPAFRTNNLDSTVQRGRLLEVAADLRLWRLNISVFMLHFLLISAFSMFPLLFDATGQIAREDHATWYFCLLIGSFVLMAPIMWISDRIRDIRKVLLTSVGLALIAFVILLSTRQFYPVIIAMTLYFMSFNLLEVILPAQLSRTARAGLRGTSMGVYTTCQFLGIFAGGTISGLLVQLWGISAVLAANTLLVLLWLILCAGFPSLGQIGSRTVQLGGKGGRSPQERVDALSSINGVIEAVVIESDRVAYLKVDEQIFDDQQLNQVVAQISDS
ncbi:MAG: MFS transporter [Proteobacteria bacterium]|nr:MFS transporter [Pseudomonadota bacterium]